MVAPMQRVTRLGIASMLAIGAMVVACESSTTRSSEVAVAPTGRWRQAHVEVRYGPRFSKNGRWHPPHVNHDLFIDWDRPHNRALVILLSETADSLSPRAFAEARGTTYTLRFAPDAHALALSTDGARTWTNVDLTPLTGPTAQPFWCPHRTFSSLDPWPSSRALALEILAASDPNSAAARVHRAPDAAEWPIGHERAHRDVAWRTDFHGATRYACAHRDDAELQTAFNTAVQRMGRDAGYLSWCVSNDPTHRTP